MLCYVYIGLFLEKTNPVVNPVVASQKQLLASSMSHIYSTELKTQKQKRQNHRISIGLFSRIIKSKHKFKTKRFYPGQRLAFSRGQRQIAISRKQR